MNSLLVNVNIGKQAPIAYIFGFGVAIGFLVGAVIVYQILYREIICQNTPRWRQWATVMRISSELSFKSLFS